MKPQIKAFRDTASQVCQHRGYPFHRFMKDYNLEAVLLQADADNAPPAEIAVRVLLGCCVAEGKFNNFTVGFLAVMTYLNERLGTLGRSEQVAFADLAAILQKSPTEQAVRRWFETHYPSP